MVQLRRSREEWRELVEQHEASGMSVVDFAQREGLKAKTFGWWRWEIRRGRSAASTPNAAHLTLIAVPARVPAQPLIIRLSGGTELQVPAGAEPDWIGRIADALR